MESMADLFGNYHLIKKGKPLSERSTIIEYFVQELKKEPRVIAIRMSHYNLDQLYAIQSSYKDRLARNGKESADKYVWWVSRTENCG